MSHPCSPLQLEALARGELTPQDAARCEAHLAGCAACRHELQWLTYERAAFHARAEQQAPAKASLWRALEARLAPAPPRARWHHAGRLAAGALATAAAVLLLVTSPARSPERPERLGSGDEPLASYAVGPACLDDGRAAALDATERRFSACLIATPAFPY